MRIANAMVIFQESPWILRFCPISCNDILFPVMIIAFKYQAAFVVHQYFEVQAPYWATE